MTKDRSPIGEGEAFSQQAIRDGILAMRISQQPGFEKLDPFQAIHAREALEIIQYAIAQEIINPEHLRKIADFGIGYGGPTFALDTIARATDGSVDAIEESESLTSKIVAAKILPSARVINENGIDYLGAAERANEYDLITAFMLGPDYHGDLFRSLAAAASSALRPSGSLIVTSDGFTFSKAKSIAEQSGNSITVFNRRDTGLLRNVLIVPQATCTAIKNIKREI